jgi:hypothetical protein
VLDSFPTDVEAKLDRELAKRKKLTPEQKVEIKAAITDKWNTTYHGSYALGQTLAGEKMTAIGGFVFDPSANGIENVTVRAFSSPPSGDRCAAIAPAGLIAWTETDASGFYFLWKMGDNTTSGGTNNLPSGFTYYLALCDLTGPPGSGTAMPFAQAYWPARSLPNKLGNKEFTVQDFYVSGPTRLTFQAQPLTVGQGKNMTLKVALLDGFGQVMTIDNGASTVTLSLDSGQGGTLSAASGLTKSLVKGVATWTDAKISATSAQYGNYVINARSSHWPYVPNLKSFTINVTK